MYDFGGRLFEGGVYNCCIKCLGLVVLVVINGRLIWVCVIEDSFILVFFVVLNKCCSVWGFWCRSIYLVFWNLLVKRWME